ncbi:hypothetical protein [Paenibacillus campi]|uniref:hypothetical protein n=1 Tax=Paenibacillus campi TaxID=3106031 RepID=UPI002AFEFFE8|nr:hypothetical protein [Paenibacillus sp. SGZ-1009]
MIGITVSKIGTEFRHCLREHGEQHRYDCVGSALRVAIMWWMQQLTEALTP